MRPILIKLAVDVVAIAGALIFAWCLGPLIYFLVAAGALPLLAVPARTRLPGMLPELVVLATMWPVTFAALTLRVAVGSRDRALHGDGPEGGSP